MVDQQTPQNPDWEGDELELQLEFMEKWNDYLIIVRKLTRVQRKICRNSQQFHYFYHHFCLLVFGITTDGPSLRDMQIHWTRFWAQDLMLRNERDRLLRREAYMLDVLDESTWWNRGR